MTQKGPEDQQATGGSLSDLESKNRAARFFRNQFKLNRPRFWNNWGDLTAEEVKAAARAVLRDAQSVTGVLLPKPTS